MNELELIKLFSKNLKRIMKEENIKQEDLADEVGISQQMISRYVTGACLPSLYTTVKLADALFCTIDDFLEEK